MQKNSLLKMWLGQEIGSSDKSRKNILKCGVNNVKCDQML